MEQADVCYSRATDNYLENSIYCGSGLQTNGLSPSLTFRPRGSLARVLYYKQRRDQYLSYFDKSQVSVFIFKLLFFCLGILLLKSCTNLIFLS